METLPRHIGIIMDGNGRWAAARRRPRTFGHLRGARVAKNIITHAARRGVSNLTLFAFSTENWLRPAAEVHFLMNLLRRQIVRESDDLVRENIRFSTIGDLKRLPTDLIRAIDSLVERTTNNSGMHLTFALNYGSRWEITEAAKALAQKVLSGELTVEDIEESALAAQLQTSPQPDPDLIIRTSGESRLSNFMLWQAAYAELYFTPTHWPDFQVSDFEAALQSFASRNRRFGQVQNDRPLA